MPTYQDSAINTRQRMLGNYGNGNFINGVLTPSSAVATADKLRFARIPAGMEVHALLMQWASQGTTVPVDIGYEPVDSNEGSMAANTTYFRAALAMGTASADGTLLMGFDPIRFDQDVYITGTVGAVTAGAAAKSRITAIGDAKGVK